MTIEELKRLKPLDITKLDKSQWEDANAVLGVDSNDDVVMATPEDFAKESEIQEIISDINDIRTSITSGDTETLESAKAYTDDKLGDYYTKNEVEEKIDEATSGITVDAYTKAEADARFQPIGDYATEAYVTAATADFVTSGDVATQVSDFTYSKAVIDEKVAGGGSFDPTQYYTKTEVDNEISAATEDLVTSGEVETQITSKGYATTGYVEDAISGISVPTKTSDLTNDSGYITESALSGLASETYVDNATSGKVDSSTFNTYTGDTATVLEGKADTSDIPDVSNFVTSGDVETQITEKGYATTTYVDNAVSSATVDMATTGDVATAVSGLASESYVTNAITAATDDMATQTWVGQQGYLTQHQSLAGLAASVFYDSTAHTIYFYDKDGTPLATSVDTTDFIKDGMIDDVAIVNGYLVITFNTDSGKETISIPLTDIFDPDNYYTKNEVDAAITGATDDMATQTWVQNQGYLTQHQDISGKLDVSVFTGYTGATETVLESKADITDIPDVSGFVTSGDVETQITSKGYATETYVDSAITAATADMATTGDVASAVSGLASETYVDSAVTAATVDMATTGDVATAVSGLASENYVDAAITAATDDMATQTWVQNQGYLTQHQDISGKLDTTVFTGYTASTETVLAGKADTSDIPDVSNFVTSGDVATQVSDYTYSKAVIDEKVASGGTFDPTQYYTKTQVDNAISSATEDLASEAYVTAATADFVTSGDVETQITSKNYATTGYVDSAVSGLASESYVTNAITAATSDFVTSGEVETQITGKGYITESALVGYATEAYVTAATEDMATTGDVATAVSGLASESYVTNAVTAATDDMATQTWVQNQGYLTQHQDISGKLDTTVFTGYTAATEETLNSKADVAYMTVTTGSTSSWKIGPNYAYNTNVSNLIVRYINSYTAGNNLSISDQNGNWLYNENINWKDKTTLTQGWLYAKVNHGGPFYVFIWTDTKEIYVTDSLEIPVEFATKVYVDNAVSGLASEAYVTAATADFVTSGDVETQITSKNYATTGYVDSAVSGLASENYVDAAVTAATVDMATTGDVASAVSGLASESYVTNAVTAATDDMATQTWVGQQGFLTEHQDISGKLDTSVFTGYTASTETVLESKANVSDIPDVSGFVTSGEVETQITNKGYATEAYVNNGLTSKANKIKSSSTTLAYTLDDYSGSRWQLDSSAGSSTIGYVAQEDSNVIASQQPYYPWMEGQDYKYCLSDSDNSKYYAPSGLTTEGPTPDTIYELSEYSEDVYMAWNNAGGLTSGLWYIFFDLTNMKMWVSTGTSITISTTYDVVYEDQLPDVSEFVTSGDVQSQITAATQDLASQNYVDSAITAATADMATTGDVATKQDTLISGTNIKTINGNSLLGSGNIVIQGGGGTGGTEYFAGENISIDTGNTISVTGITSQLNTVWVDGGQEEYVESGTGYDLYSTFVENNIYTVMSDNNDVIFQQTRIYGQSTDKSYWLKENGVEQYYGITNTGGTIELDTVYDLVDAGTDSSNLTNPIHISGFSEYFNVYLCFDLTNMKMWMSSVLMYQTEENQSIVYGTMPTAQDGSPKKMFVYDSGAYDGKRVIAKTLLTINQLNGKLNFTPGAEFWNKPNSTQSFDSVTAPAATSVADGVMSSKDKARFDDINNSLTMTSAYTIGSSTSGETDEYYFEVNDTRTYFNHTNVNGIYALAFTPSGTDMFFNIHKDSDDGQGGTSMHMYHWTEVWLTDGSELPIERTMTEEWSGSYFNFGSYTGTIYFIWNSETNVMSFQSNLNYVGGYRPIVSSSDVLTIVKISQSDYDNLQTKSATTLYIIV